MTEFDLSPLTIGGAIAARELINRSEAHDGVPRVMTQGEFDEQFDEPHFDPPADARVVVVDGRTVGFCRVWHQPSGTGLERAYVHGAVDPSYRNQGVGRRLLAWGSERATQRLLAIDNDLPKFVRVSSLDFVESAQRLFRRLGFEPVRWFEELLRPLQSLPEPRVPDGLRIIPFPVDRTDEVRVAKNASFSDHWGSTVLDAASWAAFTCSPSSRLDLSFVAEEIATGRIVAHCLNDCYPQDDELLGRRDFVIDNLGTIREWRGRGVASALIHTSMRAFAAVGRTHASIEVDSASPTGASRLYRSLGFEPMHRSVTSQIQVA